MAAMQLQPPNPFDFGQPDQWLRWKQRFEQFRQASGLAAERAPKQISMLLYCMGPDAEDMLQTTGITADECAAYASVIQKFDDHFRVRKNIIYERAKFNTRKQQPGESGEQYILALYTLAANCDYTGERKEQAICDRLVVGIRDVALSKQLQMDSELTLEKVNSGGSRNFKRGVPIACNKSLIFINNYVILRHY